MNNNYVKTVNLMHKNILAYSDEFCIFYTKFFLRRFLSFITTWLDICVFNSVNFTVKNIIQTNTLVFLPRFSMPPAIASYYHCVRIYVYIREVVLFMLGGITKVYGPPRRMRRDVTTHLIKCYVRLVRGTYENFKRHLFSNSGNEILYYNRSRFSFPDRTLPRIRGIAAQFSEDPCNCLYFL